MWLTQVEIEEREQRRWEQEEARMAVERHYPAENASYELACNHIRQHVEEFGVPPRDFRAEIGKCRDLDCLPLGTSGAGWTARLLKYDSDCDVAVYFIHVEF